MEIKFFIRKKRVNITGNSDYMRFLMPYAEIKKIETQRDESHIKQSSYMATREEKKRQAEILSSW